MPTDGTTDQRVSPIDELARKLGATWPRIVGARSAAERKIAELDSALTDETSADTNVVVHGSLARKEFTRESDLDWTLLVDGQANPQHQSDLLSIREKLLKLGRPPGPEKTFGTLTFSQPILHMIGGQEDTNANTTRRVLLLLEAYPLGREQQAFTRVRKNILHRYLTEDHGLSRKPGTGEIRWVPLFLLNDMARYWRTMTVDFAYKQWNRGNEGYALRSIKLGISRKLIYASGLLSCFWCDPTVSKANYSQRSPAEKIPILNTSLDLMFSLTPLERFAKFFLTHSENQHLMGAAQAFFDIYDEFLALLEDQSERAYLKALSAEKMDEDPKFQFARRIRSRFEDAIKAVFLNQDSLLYQHTIARGVF